MDCRCPGSQVDSFLPGRPQDGRKSSLGHETRPLVSPLFLIPASLQGPGQHVIDGALLILHYKDHSSDILCIHYQSNDNEH